MTDLPFYIMLALLLGLILGALPGYLTSRRRDTAPPIAKKSTAPRDEAQAVEPVSTEYAVTASPLSYRSETSHEVLLLRNELEQCNIELNILRQDYDLDTYLLNQDLEQTKSQLNRERASIEEERRILQKERASLAEVRDQFLDERSPLVRERTALAEERTILDQERMRFEATRMQLKKERDTLYKNREVLAEQAERLAELEASLEKREASLEKREAELENAPQAPLIEFTTRPKAQSIRSFPTTLSPRPTPVRTYTRKAPADDQAKKPVPTVEPREAGRPAYAPLPSLIDQAMSAEAPLHDSLTKIWGIDQEIEQQLYGMGYSTFDDINGMSSTDIQQIARKLELDPKHIQAHWVSQAQLLRFEPQKK
jgi:predicted flap endonuclease-1-like 5' DNA nuclease